MPLWHALCVGSGYQTQALSLVWQELHQLRSLPSICLAFDIHSGEQARVLLLLRQALYSLICPPGLHLPPFFLKIYFYYMCMSILSACMLMHHKYACSLGRPEEVIESPGTGVKYGFESLHEYLKLNLGSLEKQPVPSTTKQSLQPFT